MNFKNLTVGLFIFLISPMAFALSPKDVDVTSVSSIKRTYKIINPEKAFQTCHDTFREIFDNERGAYDCRCQILEASPTANFQKTADLSEYLDLPSMTYSDPKSQQSYILKTFNDHGELLISFSRVKSANFTSSNACDYWTEAENFIHEFIKDLSHKSTSTVFFRSSDEPLQNTSEYTETLLKSKTYRVLNQPLTWFSVQQCKNSWQIKSISPTVNLTYGECTIEIPTNLESIHYLDGSDVLLNGKSFTFYSGKIGGGAKTGDIKTITFKPIEMTRNVGIVHVELHSKAYSTQNTWQESEETILELENYLKKQTTSYWTDSPQKIDSSVSELRVVHRILDLSTINDLNGLKSRWYSRAAILQLYNYNSPQNNYFRLLNDLSPNALTLDVQTPYGPTTLTITIRETAVDIQSSLQHDLTWEEIETGIGQLLYEYSLNPVGPTLML